MRCELNKVIRHLSAGIRWEFTDIEETVKYYRSHSCIYTMLKCTCLILEDCRQYQTEGPLPALFTGCANCCLVALLDNSSCRISRIL